MIAYKNIFSKPSSDKNKLCFRKFVITSQIMESIVVKIAILIVGSYDPTILHTKNDQDLNKIVIRVGSYQDRRIARRIVGSDRRIVGSPSYLFFCFLIFFFYINLLSISPCLKAQWLRILHESYYFDVVNWLSFCKINEWQIIMFLRII